MAKDDLTQSWLKRISKGKQDSEHWIGRGESIIEVYRNETGRDSTSNTRRTATNSTNGPIKTPNYNALYVNTEIIRPALFAKAPVPDVRRRFTDENQIATQAASIMQDALAFFIDDNYKVDMDAAVKDYILAGRGHMRVRFIPTMEKRHVDVVRRTTPSSSGDSHVHTMESGSKRTKETIHGEPHRHDVIAGQIAPAIHPGDDQPHTHEFEDLARTIAALQGQDIQAQAIEIDANGTPFIEDMVFEEIAFEHVEWKEVIIPKVRKWRDVPWIAFIHDMTKDDIKERFGSKALELVQFETVDDGSEVTIEVFEVWDKDKREVIHVSEGAEKPLEGPSPDPLGLELFFPIPKPLTANPTSGSLIPIPDYTQYQVLAGQLDDITLRIGKLTRALKARGAYNAQFGDLGKVIEGDDNEMIPIDSMGTANERGGMSNHIWMLPLDETEKAIERLYQARAETIQAISDLSGVSDILRGVTNPNEAMGTNRIKGQFATLRLRDRQEEIMRFNRDLLRLAAELISNTFQTSTLSRITGEQVNEKVMAVLRDDAMRNFNIDVETDSTIAVDEVAEQEAVTKMMTGLVAMVEGFGPAVESGSLPADIVAALFKIALRPFKGAREIEAVLSNIDTPDAQAQAMQQQLEQKDMQIQGMQQQLQQLMADREIEKAALAITAQAEEARAANEAEKRALDAEKQEGDLALGFEKIHQQAVSDHEDRVVKLNIEDEKINLGADKAALESIDRARSSVQ